MLKLWLPTLSLFYSFAPVGLHPGMSYRQVFGNTRTYLDLYFDTNPEGFLRRASSDPIRFSGYYVTEKSEEPIRGHLLLEGDTRFYLFNMASGKFVGSLKGRKGSCEKNLRYGIYTQQTLTDSGSLSAGFCI